MAAKSVLRNPEITENKVNSEFCHAVLLIYEKDGVY